MFPGTTHSLWKQVRLPSAGAGDSPLPCLVDGIEVALVVLDGGAGVLGLENGNMRFEGRRGLLAQPVEGAGGEMAGLGYPGVSDAQLAVLRNTGAVPIRLAYGSLYRNELDASVDELWAPVEPPVPDPSLPPGLPLELRGIREPVYIPAHGTWRGRVRIMEKNADRLELSQAIFGYRYASPVRLAILSRYGKLYLHLPGSVEKKRPYIGSYQEAHAPLEISP